MHVFITGGTGLIGSPVVAELIDHGHTVLALARSDASAQAVATSVAEETAALDTLGDELRGSDRRFVLVSGTPWVAAGCPPKRTRCRPTDRSAVAGGPSTRPSPWPRRGCAPRPCACPARFTTRARAGSRGC